MTTLRKPALGPIVGHTTHKSCRLWIAASATTSEPDALASQRTIGVLGVVSAGGTVKAEDIFYFRLRREYDRTGSINLGVDTSLWTDPNHQQNIQPYALKADTEYTVRMASLRLDDAYPADSNVQSEAVVSKLPAPSVWADKFNLDRGLGEVFLEAKFRTQPKPLARKKKSPLSFLMGSCRYPGLGWKRKESDRIFAPMLQEHLRDPVNFVMMMGDQIYADLLNRFVPIGLADTYAEFQERYHTAFGSRNMRALLNSVPTYMILDDHEIEDNWSQDRLHKRREVFNWAIGAYMSYQWSHGPRFEDSYVHSLPTGQSDHLKRKQTIHLFYDFSCSGYPFFVLDTRTQRYRQEAGLHDNHLLGRPSLHESEPNQLDRLCAWLVHMQKSQKNVPKFIVSSSVFLPNPVDERSQEGQEKSDSWPAFPETRDRILKTIVENRIENVVFLCGDIHCANITRMTFSGRGEGLTAYTIVSSAFYWPFSFADGDPSNFVHDSRHPTTLDGFELSDGLGRMDYETWGFTQADNYCRVDADPEAGELVVHMYDRDGQPLETRKWNDEYSKEPERLRMASW